MWQRYKQERGCLVHFVRLATNALLKDNGSARDNHVLAKYSPISNFFSTHRLSIDNPPHLKYVPTLRCNLLPIACFLTLVFPKVVWQHMQGAVGFLISV